MRAYKLIQPDGTSFHDGRTKWRVGKTVRVRNKGQMLCGKGMLHACQNPNDCFVGARIPCRALLVEGEAVVDDGAKFGFHALKVLEEIADLDALFGWRYSEAIDPVCPFAVSPPTITEAELALLRGWASVRDSVRDSVWASVRDSVWASVWASVRDSVGDSVWASVRDSVGDSVWAYIGSLFPNIKKWRYFEAQDGYPFTSGEKLWRLGLVPSFDGKEWRLHGGRDGQALWQGNLSELPP
jgi:hypothetical protein